MNDRLVTRSGSTLAEILVQTSIDGLLVVDREYRYLLWNRAMERYSGLPAEEVIGRKMFEVFPFLRAQGLDEPIDRALSGEVGTAEDMPFTTPDGVDHYFDRLYIPLRDDGGAIIGMLGVVRDVTARRHAQDALRRSEEQLRVAVDSAGVGLWRWDVGADVVTWEDPLCAIFGLPPGSFPKGRAEYLELIHPEDRGRSSERIRRGLAAGDWEDEYRILRADGVVRWVMSKGRVIREGVVLGAVIDITERHGREEQLRQAQKLEAVGQLTAGVAHNFNNVLMGMIPSLEMAARRAPPELSPLLRGIEHSAERAADLVRQLMTYAGRNRPRARATEALGELADRTLALCVTTFDSRIAITTRYDESACACVDGPQVEQALLNVIINARDALAEADVASPRIAIAVDLVPEGAPELEGRLGEHARIRVTDNGVGMAAATSSRIFEPFFTTKPVGKGTGLGLATTRAIVFEHGGFILCESAPGEGTTFSLYLKSDPGEPLPPRVPSEPPPASSVRGTETILVVDDEAPIRHLVSIMLGGAGFVARTAASGEEALALLEDARFAAEVALVLLDVSMPGIAGRELRARLRALAPHLRVVYFTGYAYEAADPGDAVLEKPVTERRLLSMVRKVLDRAPSRRLP